MRSLLHNFERRNAVVLMTTSIRSQERNVANTSHRYCVNFTGCRSDDEFFWIQDGQLGIYYQVLSSKVPDYLADDIHLASENSGCSLRSSSGRKCSVTRVHSRFGDRCFAAAGPRIWNNLPASLRDKKVSCTEFRKQLKTFMFQTDCGASWLFWLSRLINTLTYLLTYLSVVNVFRIRVSMENKKAQYERRLCYKIVNIVNMKFWLESMR